MALASQFFSCVKDVVRYTPTVRNGGRSGSVQKWWSAIFQEPGNSLPSKSGLFAKPYALEGRRLVLVPDENKRAFAQFQGLFAKAYPEICVDHDFLFADDQECAGFSRALDGCASTIGRGDAKGEDSSADITIMRVVRDISASCRTGPQVLAAYL